MGYLAIKVLERVEFIFEVDYGQGQHALYQGTQWVQCEALCYKTEGIHPLFGGQ